MFCEECGAKIKKDSAFCEECGHKIKKLKETNKNAKEEVKATDKEEKVVKKVVKKEPMSKGKKILIGAIAIVVVVLIGTYMYMSSLFTPEKIALKYFKAYNAKDADKLCSTIKLDESEFVSKKLLKESLKDEEKIKITNYKTEKVKSNDGLSASVIIKYIEDGSSKEKSKTIRLIKDKKKKYLFFDNWTVDSSDLIVKKFSITVPKNSTAYIDGVKVSDKYKEKAYSGDKYVIPSILKGSYKLEVKLKSGLNLQGTLKVDNSLFSTVKLKIDEKTEKELLKQAKDQVTLIYDSILSDKSFDDIKDKFDEDYQDDIKYTYESIKQNVLTDYNKLKEFKITNATLKYYNISDDKLELTVQLEYDYKVEYKSLNETKEYSKTGKTSNVYITYKLNKKGYVISNMRSLISYFSHYSY